MISYKFYYINLDKSKDRRDFMEKQFNELNIPITRISAVYGKDLDRVFIKKEKKKHNILAHFPFPNDGEIGICLTHFKLWEFLSKQPEDFSIVLEDDALIQNNLIKDLERILKKVTIDTFVDISGKKGFYSLEKNELINKYLIPPVLMIGQIIGKNAAKKLYENLSNYYAPIDVMKQDIYKHRVALYSTNKSYVVSIDKKIGGSTIQQNNMIVWKKIIREIIRPFWQLIALVTYKLQRCVKNYLFYKK
ncbi:glycosyltransferase family 25 protein [Polaribacter aquimarinus]|uniref:LPS biosynthesis glycosyltransferase n=1 Tax=Polaribacter aquimarinus TaxID=2100726 RepID=A0A2U2JAS2_9FLAO|nr:glycosyltransferase family 25 protein [Polaribacter aquimarinus]PWG05430.1 LPS biosynthesis glycosyltransferase [Polaribacter aquimarinus]